MGSREKLQFKSDNFIAVQFLDLRFRVEINNKLTNNIVILLVGLLDKLVDENNNSHLDNNKKNKDVVNPVIHLIRIQLN